MRGGSMRGRLHTIICGGYEYMKLSNKAELGKYAIEPGEYQRIWREAG